MNIYIRLFALLISRWLSPQPKHPLDAMRLSYRVLLNDLDLNRHMTNSRYLTIMDLGRIDYMLNTGLFKVCRERKWMPIIGRANIEFLRPLKFWQKYTLTTKVVYWDEKWCYMLQEFEYNNKIMARSVVRALFRSKDGSILPETVLEAVEHKHNELPAIPDEIKHLI